MNEHYCTIINDPRSKSHLRIAVAARHGDLVSMTGLTASPCDWDAARAEAQELYPDRSVVVLALGETPPLAPGVRPKTLACTSDRHAACSGTIDQPKWATEVHGPCHCDCHKEA